MSNNNSGSAKVRIYDLAKKLNKSNKEIMAILETFKGTETEVGFSAVQIILLIELGQAQDAYTYPLPEEEDITDEDYILAAQDLQHLCPGKSGDGRHGKHGQRHTGQNTGIQFLC